MNRKVAAVWWIWWIWWIVVIGTLFIPSQFVMTKGGVVITRFRLVDGYLYLPSALSEFNDVLPIASMLIGMHVIVAGLAFFLAKWVVSYLHAT